MAHAGSVEECQKPEMEKSKEPNQSHHIMLTYTTLQRKAIGVFNPNDHHILNIPGRYNICSTQ